MSQTTFTVPDMACTGCKANIEAALGDLAGVESVQADPQSKLVEVSYEEASVDEARLSEAIQTAGYTVSA